MDFKYKEKKNREVLMVSYISPYGAGESTNTATTTIYMEADDDSIHAVTLVKKQGVYTLKVNQTPE